MYSAESQNKTKQKLFCVTKHTNVAVCGRSGWGSTACRLPSNPICWKTTLREPSWCWGARETRDWPCSSPWRGCGWCFHTVNSGIKILLIAWKQQSYRSNITFHSRLTMIVIIVISMNFARLLDWIHPALEHAKTKAEWHRHRRKRLWHCMLYTLFIILELRKKTKLSIPQHMLIVA